MAIIHLLRAKGCCSDQKQPTDSSNFDQEALIKLKVMKSSIEHKLEDVNEQMRNVPCAIKLEAEVAELEGLVRGLRSENELRRQ